MSRTGAQTEVVPQDGVRRRFHVIRGNQRLHILLERDGFQAARPIRFDDALDRISFEIENRAPGAADHQLTMTVSGLPAGTYEVSVDGAPVSKLRGGETREAVSLRSGRKKTASVLIQARAFP